MHTIRAYTGEKRYLLFLLWRFDPFLDHGLHKLLPSPRSSLLPPSNSENRCITPLILNIATGWWVASFTSRQLYFGDERAPGTQRTGGLVGPESAGRWLEPTCLLDYRGFIRTSLMHIVLFCFYYTICSTCFGCNTHPSSGAIWNIHADGTGKCTCKLTCSICMYILYRSWGWMCITSETCRANSVIKTALNNLHQVGPNKTHNLFSVSCLQYAQRQRSRTSELITIRCAFFNFI